MKKLSLIVSILFCFFISKQVKSQNCGSCDISIFGNDTLSYTVFAGQSVCIDSAANFTGILILNGGTICNKGLFTPMNFTFNSGTINNYSNITITQSIIINANCNVIINDGGAFSITSGDLHINGGNFTNNGLTSISGNIQNASGTITNSSLVNCSHLLGNPLTSNSGIVNSN